MIRGKAKRKSVNHSVRKDVTPFCRNENITHSPNHTSHWTEFESRSVSCGPSFFAFALGPEIQTKKAVCNLQYGSRKTRIFIIYLGLTRKDKDFSSSGTATNDWRASNPKYQSILLASNKNWTLCCQNFQSTRLTHIFQYNAKLFENNRLSKQSSSATNRDTAFCK